MKTGCVLFVFGALFHLGWAQTQWGPNNPSTRTQVTTGAGGEVSWSNTTNIGASDNAYATATGSSATTQYLQATNFGFTLTNTDVVQGIRMSVERSYTPAASVTRMTSWTETGGTSMNHTLSAGNRRMLVVVLGCENGTTVPTFSVTYAGIALTQISTITVQTGSGFTATLQFWILREANLPANGTHSIAYTRSGTEIEFFTSMAAAIFQNVDQVSPFTNFISEGTSSTAAAHQLPSAMTNGAGSMGIMTSFCGNNTTPSKAASGQTGCFTINLSYNTQIDVYRSNAGFGTSGGCMYVGDKSYASEASDQPTITFLGTPNRRVIMGAAFRRAGVSDNLVRLTLSGAYVGNSLAAAGTIWPTTDAVQNYGGPSNTWGRSWTWSEINSSTFGGGVSGFVDQGTANVDHIQMTVFTSSVLPIHLAHFEVTRNGNLNQLNWVTASEILSRHIVVERSVDGYHFDSINTVQAAGTSHEASWYSYEDRFSSSTTYYRLKLVDLDGQFEYSDTKSVQNEAVENRIYPNPISDWGKVMLADEADRAMIMNLNGQLVCEAVRGPDNEWLIDMENEADGSYYFVTVSATGKKVLSFQKRTR